MFIPQANPNSPLRSGVNSTAVLPKAASDLLTWKSGKTTRELQSLFSWRLKTSRTGTPLATRIRSGE